MKVWKGKANEAMRCGQVAADPAKHIIEILMVSGGFAFAVIYLLWFLLCGTQQSMYRRSLKERKRWTRLMMETPTNNIFGVQATRNVPSPP